LGAEPDLLYWQQVPGFHAECPGYCSFFSQRIAPDGQAAASTGQYRDDAKTPPEKTVQEMKEFLNKELLKQQQSRK